MTAHRNRFTTFEEGKARFDRAMQDVPDRVPVYAQMHEFVMKEMHANASEFYTTPETLVVGTLETCEKYGIDVALVDYDVYNIEAEALGQRMIYRDHAMPDVDRSAPLIQEPRDLKKIRTPHFDSEGRLPNVIETYSIFKRLTGLDPVMEFSAPFSLAANVRGIEGLLHDLYEKPRFAKHLLDRLTEEVLAPWILHLKWAFPSAAGICGNDATASPPIVSPGILKNWVIPYILRLRGLCDSEIYVPNWVGERYLANPEEMLDLKRKVCPGFVEGQDPDVERLGPALYKAYAERHGIPLILGIGAGFMALASPKEIEERVRHYIEEGGENGRFAIYLCNLGATTPPENVRAAVRAIRRYGTYSCKPI